MIYIYESLIELRAAWESYERRSAGGTTVLVLDPNFGGDLSSLVRREQPQTRLILAAAEGPLPQLAFGGLIEPGRTGWDEIYCADNWRRAIDDARRALRPGEELAIFWPAWREQQLPEQRRQDADTMEQSASHSRRAALSTPRGSVA